MRIPDYLSPTSVKLFYSDREAFYLRYLADEREPREPQNCHMAIGSAFDAYAKSYLHEALFGKGADPRYAFDSLFQDQVEPHNRDMALVDGAHAFEEYRKMGCFATMMLELGKAVGEPHFEFTINDTINGIPLLGKPDIHFLSEKGARVVYDWKVNGYYSSRTKSPMKGYINLMPGNKTHKDCFLLTVNGIMINIGMFLEDGNRDWADQLSIYSWLLGEPVGSEQMIVGIDQVCGPKDKLRFATHRLRISSDHQFDLMMLVEDAWKLITKKHVFDNLSLEESQERCELLDDMSYDEDFEACL